MWKTRSRGGVLVETGGTGGSGVIVFRGERRGAIGSRFGETSSSGRIAVAESRNGNISAELERAETMTSVFDPAFGDAIENLAFPLFTTSESGLPVAWVDFSTDAFEAPGPPEIERSPTLSEIDATAAPNAARRQSVFQRGERSMRGDRPGFRPSRGKIPRRDPLNRGRRQGFRSAPRVVRLESIAPVVSGFWAVAGS